MNDTLVQTVTLSTHGLAMLAFAAIVFAIFISDRVPIATVSIGILALLPIGFVLFPLRTADGSFRPADTSSPASAIRRWWRSAR